MIRPSAIPPGVPMKPKSDFSSQQFAIMAAIEKLNNGTSLLEALTSQYHEDSDIWKNEVASKDLINTLCKILKTIGYSVLSRRISDAYDDGDYELLSKELNRFNSMARYNISLQRTNDSQFLDVPKDAFLSVLSKEAITGALVGGGGAALFGLLFTKRGRSLGMGAGVLGIGAKVAYDSMTKDKSLKEIEKMNQIRKHFELPKEKFDAKFINAIFLYFFIDLNLSRVTCKHIQNFVKSKGMINYDIIVTRSPYLSRFYKSLNSVEKKNFLDVLSIIIKKITPSGTNARELNKPFASKLFTYINDQTEISGFDMDSIPKEVQMPSTPEETPNPFDNLPDGMPTVPLEHGKIEDLYEGSFQVTRTHVVVDADGMMYMRLEFGGKDGSGNPKDPQHVNPVTVKTTISTVLTNLGVTDPQPKVLLQHTDSTSSTTEYLVQVGVLALGRTRSFASMPGISSSTFEGDLFIQSLDQGSVRYNISSPLGRLRLRFAGCIDSADRITQNFPAPKSGASSLPKFASISTLAELKPSLTNLESKIKERLQDVSSANAAEYYSYIATLLQICLLKPVDLREKKDIISKLYECKTLCDMYKFLLEVLTSVEVTDYAKSYPTHKDKTPIDFVSNMRKEAQSLNLNKFQTETVIWRYAHAVAYEDGRRQLLPSLKPKANHTEIFEAATQACLSKFKELKMYTETITETNVSGKPKSISVVDRIHLQAARKFMLTAGFTEDASPKYDPSKTSKEYVARRNDTALNSPGTTNAFGPIGNYQQLQSPPAGLFFSYTKNPSK